MSLLSLLIHCFVSSEEKEELNCISSMNAASRNTYLAHKANHLIWLSWAKGHSAEGADLYRARKPRAVAGILNLHTTIFLEYAEEMLVQRGVLTPCHAFQWVKASIFSRVTASVRVKQVLHGDSRPLFCECYRNYQILLNWTHEQSVSLW